MCRERDRTKRWGGAGIAVAAFAASLPGGAIGHSTELDGPGDERRNIVFILPDDHGVWVLDPAIVGDTLQV